ncbi:unnamed protein product, partial [Lampetra planeri]
MVCMVDRRSIANASIFSMTRVSIRSSPILGYAAFANFSRELWVARSAGGTVRKAASASSSSADDCALSSCFNNTECFHNYNHELAQNP